VSAGSGIMILLNNARHPNAAQLLVNWLASREGMEVYTRTEKLVPLRTDIEPTWTHDYAIPQPGVEYFDIYDWDYTLADKSTLGARIRAHARRPVSSTARRTDPLPGESLLASGDRSRSERSRRAAASTALAWASDQ
jgi:hypothetical protein